MSDKCVSCGLSTKRTQRAYKNRRVLSGEKYAWHIKYLQKLGKKVDECSNSVVCRKCLTRLNKNKTENQQSEEVNLATTSDKSSQTDSHSALVLPSVKRITTHASCVVCKKLVDKGCQSIPLQAKLDLLIYHNCYVTEGTRICSIHLNSSHLKPGLSVAHSVHSNSRVSLLSSEATSLLSDLLSALAHEQGRPYLDFGESSFLSDEEYLAWTGWTKNQFDRMFSFVFSKSSVLRDAREALAMFWIKMKTNLSLTQIATLFGLKPDEQGRKVVSRALQSVSGSLEEHFVPRHLGVGHISRSDAMTHMTTFSNLFFDLKLTTVWDGTYYYIQKSSQYEFSRKSWSGQKKRPLLKFMSIVFPDGYVLESIGPYMSDGKNNDAGLTKHIMTLNTDLTEWMAERDVCVVDRGFRDVVDIFEDMGLECRMPSYLGKGCTQHTLEEAYSSRLVTKVRWVVEAYHGRMKKFRFFDDVIDHNYVPSLGSFNRIMSAALNAFRPPLASPSVDDIDIARNMLKANEQKQNLLASQVESGKFSSRGRWMALDDMAAVPTFPSLSLSYLRGKACGKYQLKQAKSYTREHMTATGEYRIEVHKDADDLIRVRIQSRHVSAKKYFLWVRYSDSENADDPISAWYCQCKAGMRTVGCCAHVASVLWYLGYSRHAQNREDGTPKRKLTSAVLNAADC